MLIFRGVMPPKRAIILGLITRSLIILGFRDGFERLYCNSGLGWLWVVLGGYNLILGYFGLLWLVLAGLAWFGSRCKWGKISKNNKYLTFYFKCLPNSPTLSR